MNNTSEAKNKLAELALDAMQDTYFVFDPTTGQAIAWNRAFREISGYSDEEIKHLKAPDSYYSKEDLTLAQEASKEVTSEGNINFQMSLISKDKHVHLFDYSDSVMDDPSSDSKWIVSIGRNITKNKEIEQLFKQKQVIYNKTSQISRVGTWELDLITFESSWSDITAEIHEVERGYVPNMEKGIEFYKEGESRSKIANAVTNAIEQGVPFDLELEIITAKNNPKWIRAIGIPEIEDQKTIRLYGVFQDLTDGKTAQSALIESAEKYRTLFEMSDDAILTLNRNGVISCNQATVDLFGCKSKKEFLSKHPQDLSPKYQIDGTESRISSDKMISIAYQTGKNFFEWTHSRMDGTTFPVEILLTPMKIEGRDIIQAIVRDISKRNETELHLKRSQIIYDKTSQISRIGTWELRTDKQKLTWSDVTKEIHEVAPQYEPKLDTALNFYKEGESSLKIASVVSDALEHGLPYDVELQMTTAKGNNKWVRAIGIPERQSGKTICIFGIFQDLTSQKMVQAALIESEQKFRTLFEMSDDAIMTLNKESFITCNQATLDLFGCNTSEEFLGKHPSEISPQFQEDGVESRVAADHQIATAYEKGKNLFEWTHLKADGSPFPADVLLTPMTIDGQQVLQAIVRDISDRKKNEQQILFKNALLEAQSEASIDGIVVVNEENEVVSVNKRLMEMWNIPEEIWLQGAHDKILPHALEQLNDPDEFLSKVDYLNNNLMENSKDEIVLKNGRYFDRYSAPLHDANNLYHGRVWYFHEITEIKNIEESLKQSNERWQLAIEGTLDGMWDWNIITGHVYYSPQWEKIFGFESGEVEQNLDTMSELAHPNDLKGMYNEVDRYFKKETSLYSYDFRMYSKDGTLLWTRHRASAIFDESGNPIRMIGTTANITAYKQDQERIKNSLEEKEILLKEVHHRVKNNLQIIWGLLDIQEKRTHNDDIKSVLLDSKGRVKTMALIHENLYKGQDFTNIDLGKYIGKLILNIQSISLIPGVQIDVQNNIGNIKLGLDIITPLALIINELVGNIFKHAFKGATKGAIIIELQQNKEPYVLTIQDDGIGLPNHFDASTTKSLGIRLVQNLCRQLDATFSIKNANRGTFAEIIFHEKI